MATSPDILTSRLRLRAFSESHLTARYVGWLNDKKLMRFSEQRHKNHTVETCRAYWRGFEGSPHYFWAIEERGAENRHIGNINAYVDEQNQLADVGLLIGEPQVAGRRFGLEAWLGVCRYLLAERGLRKVTGGTLALNQAMIRIMHRAGMVEDGTRSRHYVVEGREVDVVYMAMFGSAWLSWLDSPSGAECAAHLKRHN